MMPDLVSSSSHPGDDAAEPADRHATSLRIGIVTHYMPPHLGGIELIADALFGAYLAAGCEVRWVASRSPADAPPHEQGRIRVSCWNGLERRLGIPWPVWGPAGVHELARLVRWADVLHVHDCLYLGSALTVLFARRAGKPVFVSQHIGRVQLSSALLNGIQSLAYRILGRAVLSRATHIVFCTPAAEEFVTRLLGPRGANASAIPYGIDTGRFRPPTPLERAQARRDMGVPSSSRVVLFVGRLVEKKGSDLFVEVSRRTPSCHFLMVGDGPLRPPKAANLTWLPSVAPDRMETVYHAADALLLPSKGEGFPFAVLEAMAVGLPVIASSGEPFTALLKREKACVSAERTPEALCEALNRLSPQLAGALSARGRDLVVREYSLDAMKTHYLDLIRSLSGSSGACLRRSA